MAGTGIDHSTTPRPISPILPTGALRLMLSSDPNRSIHDAAKDLTDWTHRNKCRLWCNGNLLPPDYIATSLMIVARIEADGRPRADVVSSTREAWVRQAYNFELDADEIRALLPPLKPLPPTPQPNTASQGEGETRTKPETRIKTQAWITEEAGRMKGAGQISADTTITEFALELAKRMEKAARSNPWIHPVTWGYLRNEL